MTLALNVVTAGESFPTQLSVRTARAIIAPRLILEVIRHQVRAVCGRLGKISPVMLFNLVNLCNIFRYGCIHPC
jgi:hypothetical protein